MLLRISESHHNDRSVAEVSAQDQCVSSERRKRRQPQYLNDFVMKKTKLFAG